jgi:hypothetical protein
MGTFTFTIWKERCQLMLSLIDRICTYRPRCRRPLLVHCRSSFVCSPLERRQRIKYLEVERVSLLNLQDEAKYRYRQPFLYICALGGERCILYRSLFFGTCQFQLPAPEDRTINCRIAYFSFLCCPSAPGSTLPLVL